MRPTSAAKKRTHAPQEVAGRSGRSGEDHRCRRTRDRATNTISAAVVEATDAKTLQGFVVAAGGCGRKGLYGPSGGLQGNAVRPRDRQSLNQRVRPRSGAHERHGELLEPVEAGHQGIYHKMSPKHLDRYVTEFAGWPTPAADTADQMAGIVGGMVGKRLTYADLIASNGLASAGAIMNATDADNCRVRAECTSSGILRKLRAEICQGCH